MSASYFTWERRAARKTGRSNSRSAFVASRIGTTSTAAFQPKLFMGPRWSPRRGGNLTAEPVIDVRGLTKHYADIKAVDGISFEVEKGQMFALLGPNGAGKTTTVEILEGLRDPTSGEARVLGVDVRKGYRKIRNRVGVLPQDFEPFDRLKPREAVADWAELF